MERRLSSPSMAVGKFASRTSRSSICTDNSRDRTNPIGYKLSTIAFASGSPVAASDSLTSLTDIMTNADNSKCPGSCFRPVGLALDSKGRVFMSSDSTGEIYVLAKTAASATTTSAGASPTASKKPSAGLRLEAVASTWALVAWAIVALL